MVLVQMGKKAKSIKAITLAWREQGSQDITLSSNRYLLSTYSVPGAILRLGPQQTPISALVELSSQWVTCQVEMSVLVKNRAGAMNKNYRPVTQVIIKDIFLHLLDFFLFK